LVINEKGFFVTAIHTDSGKTLASAILVDALKAHYWKPIQCGLPTDTDQLKTWFGNELNCYPEKYFLQTPASPHFAAFKEGLEIKLDDFHLPETNGNPIIVEGAGGILVPISDSVFIADLIEELKLPIILVINHYLGALNHGSLTIREIQRRGLKFYGIIFNGMDFQNAESVLLKQADCPCILRIPKMEKVTRNEIHQLSKSIEWKS